MWRWSIPKSWCDAIQKEEGILIHCDDRQEGEWNESGIARDEGACLEYNNGVQGDGVAASYMATTLQETGRGSGQPVADLAPRPEC